MVIVLGRGNGSELVTKDNNLSRRIWSDDERFHVVSDSSTTSGQRFKNRESTRRTYSILDTHLVHFLFCSCQRKLLDGGYASVSKKSIKPTLLGLLDGTNLLCI
jgi:hypothetical protein